MRFNSPETISNIKDIQVIYSINERQETKLDNAILTLSNNLDIDTADKSHVEKWETSLGLISNPGDSLNDRRFRLKSKMAERLPYSYRSIVNKLNALCDASGYNLYVDVLNQHVLCTVNLSNKGSLSDFEKILDETIPMNMTLTVELLKNTNDRVAGFTHKELTRYTHQDIGEEILTHEF